MYWIDQIENSGLKPKIQINKKIYTDKYWIFFIFFWGLYQDMLGLKFQKPITVALNGQISG
jgi:hypothetical protein